MPLTRLLLWLLSWPAGRGCDKQQQWGQPCRHGGCPSTLLPSQQPQPQAEGAAGAPCVGRAAARLRPTHAGTLHSSCASQGPHSPRSPSPSPSTAADTCAGCCVATAKASNAASSKGPCCSGCLQQQHLWRAGAPGTKVLDTQQTGRLCRCACVQALNMQALPWGRVPCSGAVLQPALCMWACAAVLVLRRQCHGLSACQGNSPFMHQQDLVASIGH